MASSSRDAQDMRGEGTGHPGRGDSEAGDLNDVKGVAYLLEAAERRFFFSPGDREGIVATMQARFASLFVERVAEATALIGGGDASAGHRLTGRELLALGEAYWYTCDERFAGALAAFSATRDGKPISAPHRKPRSKPDGWSGENVTTWERTSRLLGYLFGMNCILGSPLLNREVADRFLAFLQEEGEVLAAGLHHVPMEPSDRAAALSGIAVLGILYPEFYGRYGWREDGLGEMARRAHEFLAPEEEGAWDARYRARTCESLEAYLLLLALSLRNQLEVPGPVLAEVEGALEGLCSPRRRPRAKITSLESHLTTPRPLTSRVPLLPMIPEGKGRLSAVVKAAALLLGREDLVGAVAGPEAGLLLLLGPYGLAGSEDHGLETWDAAS